MNSDPASLANLHDIVVPEPLPLWPPAPGWLWLLGFLAVLLALLALRAFIRFQRNRYRREALAELARLQAGGESRTAPLAELSVLLKRAALTAYPRVEVAQLTGVDWFHFLDSTGGTHFADGLGEALEDSTYRTASGDWDAVQLERLFTETRRWIRQHRPLPPPPASDETTS
ncbi:DUF4381 domain-containing protein [Parahaliea aestuarii]|uniref:DUF4381 domain-containing protein n=1 Tax=Parahaliea aestuarii TaxID=1852021 RepID=A0A5C8ZLK3_9GAMM|nr:DUF4381 domain-containing protein [Parahaliea aestuarii]TXS89338.1 DUF4381 domain-containing protein [Parahaliea aestuarii]